jgi:DNA repair photolyase
MAEKASPSPVQKIRGRGALENPVGRFEKLNVVRAPERDEEGNVVSERRLETQTFRDATRTIISTNDSPDVAMEATLNPYRGCEHGCIYCYARPTHEYLGLSAGLDFETKIFVKEDAPRLLEEKLSSKNWQPRTIFFSGVTDAYQPLERTLKVTRGCIEVLAAFRNPVAIITKNNLVTRDIDLLSELAKHDAAGVMISVTTLDRELARAMEPRTSTPALRLKAIEELAKAGIPVGVMIGPVLPGLTEHEIPAILKACADAGATSAGYNMLRLPYGVKDLFQTWLREHYPDRAEKVLNRIRDMRGGELNDSTFIDRMRGNGIYAAEVAQVFKMFKKKYGLDRGKRLSAAAFRRVGGKGQPDLFDI